MKSIIPIVMCGILISIFVIFGLIEFKFNSSQTEMELKKEPKEKLA
jgi:hypothetical protein